MIPNTWIERLWNVVLSPGLWLSVLLATIYGLLFTGWRWGGWRQLWRDLAAALAGFAIGQLAGTLLGLDWLRIGQVQLLWGTLGSIVGLALGRRVWRSANDR